VVLEFPEQPLHEICVGQRVIFTIQTVFTVIFRWVWVGGSAVI
jgi:hypothetical protein